MKRLIQIVCSSILLLCSCSVKKEDITHPDTDKEPTSSLYTCLIGELVRVSLNSEVNEYFVKNNNPDMLSCKYLPDKHVICMTPLEEGKFSIHIMDSQENIVQTIVVWSSYWGSTNVEVYSFHPFEEREILVEAYDTQVKQEIEKELTDYLDDKESTKYTFDKESKKFTMTNSVTKENHEGTYKWNIDSLTLNYEGMRKKYGFESSLSRKFVIIRENRTEEYQIRYPDAGITSVKTKEIWRNWNVIVPT